MVHRNDDGVIAAAEGVFPQTVALRAEQQRQFSGGRQLRVVDGKRIRPQGQRGRFKPVLLQGGHDARRPRCLRAIRPWHLKDRAHADAHCPTVKGVTAGRGQEQTVHPQRGGVAEDGADVGGVRYIFQYRQTAGRAARNVNGLVIMYADSVTPSMEETIRETNRRRRKQVEYNELHHITPKQVQVRQNVLAKSLAGGTTGRVSAANSYDSPVYVPNPSDLGKGSVSVGFGHAALREDGAAFADGHIKADLAAVLQDPVIRSMSRDQVEKLVEEDRRRMKKSAADLDFAHAARYRDEMWALQEYLKVWKEKRKEAEC